uniref:Uncharacterized protein n=1 Tax=Rhizophora mucronata TaxID=61149 RepID=A0A2P2Q2I5_RHIMU
MLSNFLHQLLSLGIISMFTMKIE